MKDSAQMNAPIPAPKSISLAAVAKTVNHPVITLLAVALGLWLGTTQSPHLQYLRPVGDFYVALLQMCVLPFLLATIPLAVRSALASGSAGMGMRRLIFWLVVTIAAVMFISISIPATMFHYLPIDQATTDRIGALFGASANRVDMEFALDAAAAGLPGSTLETGLISVIPTNVFSALSSNDSLKVVVFALIFGVAMVMSERRSGRSIFHSLRHIQAVCIMIFDWFNILIPIGIIALIAPQVALLGPDIYAVLAPFAYAFITVSTLLLLLPLLAISFSLRVNPFRVFASFLTPLALVAATRNALICAPVAVETLKSELGAKPETCELYIPIGFAVMRFGNMVHFAIAALFIGHLLGRSFNGFELVLIAAANDGDRGKRAAVLIQ